MKPNDLPTPSTAATPWTLARRAARMNPSVIREILKVTEKPGIISFAGGLPNPGSFPVEEVTEAADRVLKEHSHRAMQYSTTEGIVELREGLSEYLHSQGMDIHSDEILITNGSQQGLDLLGRVLLDPKDTIVVSNPTYLGALQAFNYFDARYAAADSDQDGIIPDSLDEVLTSLHKNGLRPKFMYTVPTFQNPSGTVIPESRRKKMLDLAHEHDLLVIEDDPYGRLRFDGDAVPTMKAMDNEDRVLYLGTFSKIMVPGFRLAWTAGPADLVSKMVVSKQSVDLCTNAFTQFIAADLLQSGAIESHLPKIIDLYRGKRDIMLSEMDRHFPKDGVSWTKRAVTTSPRTATASATGRMIATQIRVSTQSTTSRTATASIARAVRKVTSPSERVRRQSNTSCPANPRPSANQSASQMVFPPSRGTVKKIA